MKIMFNNKEEEDFLFQNLKETDAVLEWGSGGSTIEIGKRVKELYSIEHNRSWFDKVKSEISENTTLAYIPYNKEELPGHDGTLEDYHDYINFPCSFNRLFDVIFIDGRARVECAKMAVSLLKKDGIIFIHDYRHPQEQYRRKEYEAAEEFLKHEGGVFALHKFKVK